MKSADHEGPGPCLVWHTHCSWVSSRSEISYLKGTSPQQTQEKTPMFLARKAMILATGKSGIHFTQKNLHKNKNTKRLLYHLTIF